MKLLPLLLSTCILEGHRWKDSSYNPRAKELDADVHLLGTGTADYTLLGIIVGLILTLIHTLTH